MKETGVTTSCLMVSALHYSRFIVVGLTKTLTMKDLELSSILMPLLTVRKNKVRLKAISLGRILAIGIKMRNMVLEGL